MRNSGKLYLLVLYTGADTKIIMNQGTYKFKKSLSDKMVNYYFAWNTFCILFPIGLSLMFACYNFIETHSTHLYIFEDASPTLTQAISAYGSFYLLNNTMIPLDLVVLVDWAKILYI